MRLRGELAPLGYAYRASQFWYEGATFIDSACGPAALAFAASAALQRQVRVQEVFGALRARGLLDSPSGATNSGQLALGAEGLGLRVVEARHYAEPWPDYDRFLGWHLSAQAGYHPVVLEPANGQALVDRITGAGMNATGLRYHWILLLARHPGGVSAYVGRDLPAGYWACDGANYAGGNDRTTGFQATDQLQFYDDATLLAARPCAALALERAAPTGGTPMGVTTGLGAGFLALYTRAGRTADVVLGDTYFTADEAYALLADGTGYYYNKATGALDDAHGPDVLRWLVAQQSALSAQLGAAARALADQGDALRAAQAQVAALQAQLAAVPPPAPPAPPPPPPAPVAGPVDWGQVAPLAPPREWVLAAFYARVVADARGG